MRPEARLQLPARFAGGDRRLLRMLELIEGLHTRPFNARVFAKQEEARAASRRRRAARNSPTADFHVEEEDTFSAPPIPVEKA